MIPTMIRRAAQQPVPFIHTNRYKAQRLWPPDFSKISTKHQFRLERKYKRRAKLKWARPRWTKAVKITQLGAITFVLVYGVLFMEGSNPKNPEQPFNSIRKWFFGLTGSIWSRDHQAQKKSETEDERVVNAGR